MRSSKTWGLIMYEQDWLVDEFKDMAVIGHFFYCFNVKELCHITVCWCRVNINRITFTREIKS